MDPPSSASSATDQRLTSPLPLSGLLGLPPHWSDLLRTAISIRENRMSSVTLLRRLGNHSRKNRLYRAFRELGRAIRTITLLRYLSEPQLREQITQVTNRNEAFHGFAGG